MPRVPSKKTWGRFRVGHCPQVPSQICPEVSAVSLEPPPESLAELFENRAETGSASTDSALAPLVPAQPQFSSRREMKDAASTPRKSGASRSLSSKAVYSKPDVSKLSRRDQAAVRRLAATPKITPAPTAPRSTPIARKRQNPLKVFFVLLVISGFVGGIALPAVASGASTLAAGTTQTKGAQSVKVSASIETSKVSRDTV